MEAAAHKLLHLIEAYVTHPSHTVIKFIESPLQNSTFDIAFDAQQLLENIYCTTEDGMEILCNILREFNIIHERSTGPMCRVNFINYIILYTYHILSREALEIERSTVTTMGGITYIETEDISSLFCNKKENIEESFDKNFCWNFMNEFVKELTTKGYPMDPKEVLAEVSSSSNIVENINDEDKNNKGFYLSPQVLLEYLQRVFAYDPLSWWYKAGKMAVNCFLAIYSHLIVAASATPHLPHHSLKEFDVFNSINLEKSKLTYLHSLADQFFYKVISNNDEWLTTGGGEGYVIPGIALIATIRTRKSSDSLIGTCLISPINFLEKLLQNDINRIDLLLLFSQFPDKNISRDNMGFNRLKDMVENINEGLVIILVKSHVNKDVLNLMETWGNNKRIVLIVTSVGQDIMNQLALNFRILPKSLDSISIKSVTGFLRVKSLLSHDFYKRHGKEELKYFILAFESLNNNEKDILKGIPYGIVSIIFGGRCLTECKLLEKLFIRQLHHLINIICLPLPINNIMPAGGMAEAYLISFLDYKLDKLKKESFSSLNSFKLRLMLSLRSAITSYIQSILQKSGGLTVDESLEHLNITQRHFNTEMWETKKDGLSGNYTDTNFSSKEYVVGQKLYKIVVPIPPLLNISGNNWIENQKGRSTFLLADVTEWEAQIEVFSACLCIGKCLDKLCFTSVLGKRETKSNVAQGESSDELFFFPDIV